MIWDFRCQGAWALGYLTLLLGARFIGYMSMGDCIFLTCSFHVLAGACDVAHLEDLALTKASKLGPYTQTDRGTCPGVGL
jgi:hypothetical protein